MVTPTVESLSEIIAKLKDLQSKIKNIEDIPLEFAEQKETDDKSPTPEQLISLAAGHGLGLSDDETLKMFESSAETLDLLFSPRRELSCRIVAKLPTLPTDTLERLLKDDIPRLLCDETVPKVKKEVGMGESPFTEEAQTLHFIREAIEQQIDKNIEAAKAARWLKHVRPLIDEIERLLFPFWDYLKEHGSYGRAQNVVLMEIIRKGDLPFLPEVIKELERIKYKLEVESQQLSLEKAAETARKAAATKRRRIIGWIVEGIIALALLVIFSYFFGLVTGILVLAALFTIFHLLGWLDAIRSLFTK